MPTLHDATLAIAAGIKATLDDPPLDIADHPGQFTPAELRVLARKRRAIRIALNGVPELSINGPGQFAATPSFSAAIICTDITGTSRQQAALDLVQDILVLLPHERWGTTYLGPVLPKSISAANLYNGDIDSQGLAVWTIQWQQGFKTN
jgi:hypothetical protein